MTRFSFSTRLRRLGAIACVALFLASPAAAFQVQETNTVGPAEIRGFSLPGTRPQQQPQPEPEPTIAPVTPRAVEPRPEAPVATPTPAPAVTIAVPSTSAPASTQPRPSAARTPAAREPAPVPAEMATPAEPQSGSLVKAQPIDSLPAPEAPTPAIVASPEDPQAPVSPTSGFPWLYLLIAGAVAGLGFVGFRKLRTAGVDSTSERFTLPASQAPRQPKPTPAAPQRAGVAPTPRPEPAPAPAVSPPARPPAVGGEVIGIVMRPWLELEFRPERATATSEGAGVQYEVIIRNTGNAPARNVRLAAQMFNAGPDLDREVSAFFARGIDERGAPPLTILPRTEMKLQSMVSMPRAEMREINVQGRSLFIPTVAFNLLYAWGRDKTGQTCSSHVVGREPEQASEKMAPFRLDLGPRTYRSVGQRPSALARAV